MNLGKVLLVRGVVNRSGRWLRKSGRVNQNTRMNTSVPLEEKDMPSMQGFHSLLPTQLLAILLLFPTRHCLFNWGISGKNKNRNTHRVLFCLIVAGPPQSRE